jgi:hypothetical protein
LATYLCIACTLPHIVGHQQKAKKLASHFIIFDSSCRELRMLHQFEARGY